MGKLRTTIKLTGISLLTGICLLVFAASLPVGGWRALSVQTGSMEPAIRPGHMVLVHRVPPEAVKVGDVITYANRDDRRQTVTHRVKSIINQGGPIRFMTQGDANPAPDLPVYGHTVIGRVEKTVPFAGRMTDYARHPVTMLLSIYVPALMIIRNELRRLIKYFKQQQPYFAPEFSARLKALRRRAAYGAGAAARLSLLVLVAAMAVAVPVRAAITVDAFLDNNSITIVAEEDPGPNPAPNPTPAPPPTPPQPPGGIGGEPVHACILPAATSLLSYSPEDAYVPKQGQPPLTLSQPIPAGLYKIEAVSQDDHTANPNEPSQPNERWLLQLYGADLATPLVSTGITDDLPDNLDEQTTLVNATIELTQAVTAVRYVHNASLSGYEQAAFGGRAFDQLTSAEKRQVLWNSVHPGCVTFTPLDDTAPAGTQPARELQTVDESTAGA